MIFEPTPIDGAFLVRLELHQDERGIFARTWCREEFLAKGLNGELVQCSISYNQSRGTLRGLHYQAPPHAEAKLVRCTRGRIHDVIVDLRRSAPTFKRWWSAELSADNRHMVYIPEGLAHGFLTLEDHSEVAYQMSTPYRPESARGSRYDDPTFAIAWPFAPTVIGSRDLAFPPFDETACEFC
ncbi:MAG: dTDP-4-dehydrorhamnose 3,5-epimerase [Acidobacteriota bacterium]|nr:MAG: dTDP-4-dehydrorhamnose 3,5-epimerase [Acidobacteriota bacterium]